MTCAYDDTQSWTLPNGEPCGEDHCQVLRCNNHITSGLTCPDCLTTTRDHLARIVEASALMLPEAIHRGINSEAANLAGPAPHPGTTRARWKQGRDAASRASWDGDTFNPDRFTTLVDQLPHDDLQHPYAVLGRWQMMIQEDYAQTSNELITVAGAAAYLNRVMYRMAHDPEQDFALFARDVRKCRNHLDYVLRADAQIERGAPCHLCDTGTFIKHYTEAMGSYGKRDRAGYLLDDHGQRIPADEWICDRCRAVLGDDSYRRIVETSYVATADRLTMTDLATRTQIPRPTLKRWASGEWKRGTWVEPSLKPCGTNTSGRKLYRVDDALALRDQRAKPSGMVSLEGVV